MERNLKQNKPKLLVDFCSYSAAKYACENWHYSKSVPVGKLVKFGIWENDIFIGSIIYGRGSNPNIGTQYNLSQEECCELVRVAIRAHKTEISKMLSFTFKILKKKYPGILLIVSYADTLENHHGGIYQATNWIYQGLNQKSGGFSYKINGKFIHKRSLGAKYGRRDTKFLDSLFPDCEKRKDSDKHKYLMPLNNEMREKIKHLAKPYPKRIEHEINVSGYQPEESGVIPTDALQLKNKQKTNEE